MSRPSALSTSLMLSVLIIITGIMMIIFIHFDRGFSSLSEKTDYEQEQSQLIDHIYKKNAIRNNEIEQGTRSPASIPDTSTAPYLVSESVNTGYPAPTSRQSEQLMWSNTSIDPSLLDDELRNNPWNPYYRPGSY